MRQSAFLQLPLSSERATHSKGWLLNSVVSTSAIRGESFGWILHNKTNTENLQSPFFKALSDRKWFALRWLFCFCLYFFPNLPKGNWNTHNTVWIPDLSLSVWKLFSTCPHFLGWFSAHVCNSNNHVRQSQGKPTQFTWTALGLARVRTQTQSAWGFG